MNEKEATRRAIERFQKYVASYTCRPFTMKVFIHDMLYGIGIALEPQKYKWHPGFQKFKKILPTYLKD